MENQFGIKENQFGIKGLYYREIRNDAGEHLGCNYCIEKEGKEYWMQIGETMQEFNQRVYGEDTTAEKVKEIMQEQIDEPLQVFDVNDYWVMEIIWRSGYAYPIMFWSVRTVLFRTQTITYTISKTDFERYIKK